MTEDDQETSISRRQYLKYGSLTTGAAGLLGVAGWSVSNSNGENVVPPAEDPQRTPTDGKNAEGNPEETPGDSEPVYPYTDRFDTVVDVADHGADRNGEEPINDLLEENVADDTLFYFPEGTYHVAQLFHVRNHNNVGFVGPDATLRPTKGQVGDWLILSDVSRLLIEGLTLSNETKQTGVRTKVHVNGGENVIRDVDVVGFHDVDPDTHGFTLRVIGADTSLRLQNVALPDGARNGTGVFVHPSNDPGTLRLEDCHVENWYEQGLYGSSHGGPMYVVGGRYANNGTAQVRVGGGDADTEAVVRDVTVRIDDAQPSEHKGNVRGIWLHEGESTLVENCDVAVTDLSDAGGTGAVVLGPEQGTATMRDTTIRVDDSTFAVVATSPKTEDFVIPAMDGPPENWEFAMENVTIEGNTDRGVAVWIVDRPNCTVQRLTIDQTGNNRHGIGFLRSPGAEISDISCTTPGFSILTKAGGDGGECMVTLDNITELDSTNYQPETSSDAGSDRDEEISRLSVGSEATEPSAVNPQRTRSIRPDEGQYCLDPADFSDPEQWPGVGVTELDGEALLAHPVDVSSFNPY